APTTTSMPSLPRARTAPRVCFCSPSVTRTLIPDPSTGRRRRPIDAESPDEGPFVGGPRVEPDGLSVSQLAEDRSVHASKPADVRDVVPVDDEATSMSPDAAHELADRRDRRLGCRLVKQIHV